MTMLRSLENFKPREAVPRMLVDFALVHCSMILALAVAVMYHVHAGEGTFARTLVRSFAHYYRETFWLVSLVFPPVFLLHGFYTHSRAYSGRYKRLIIVEGVVLAALVFLAVNFFAFRGQLVPRSVLLGFGLLAVLSISSVRFGKDLILKYASPPQAASAAPEEGPVLVVGGAGYIGSMLVRKLLESGRKVRVLDSLVYGDQAIRELLDHPGLELVIGDCRNIQNVVGAVKGARSIVHLAAIVGDPACEQDHQTALEINYAATRMLIEVAKGHGIERFVFASSCSVYGASVYLMDENSTLAPVSLYAQTKVDSEAALLQARASGFHPTILRLATVFGNSYRPRFDLVVNLLTAKAYQEGVITIYNGRQWRPFIHVEDVAEAFLKVLYAPIEVVSGEIFNAGDRRLNHTLTEVAEKIRAAFPRTRIEQVENSDRRNYRVAFDKIRHRLGFECQGTLENGIEELKRAFESKAIPDYTDIRYHNQKFLEQAGSPAHAGELDAQVMAAFAPALLLATGAGEVGAPE